LGLPPVSRSNVLQVAPEPYDASFNDLSPVITLPNLGDTTTSYLDSTTLSNPGPRFYRVRLEPREPALALAIGSNGGARARFWHVHPLGSHQHPRRRNQLVTSRLPSRVWAVWGTQVPTNIYDSLYQQFNPNEFRRRPMGRHRQGCWHEIHCSRHEASRRIQHVRHFWQLIIKSPSPLCPFGRDVVKEMASACHRSGNALRHVLFAGPTGSNPDAFTATYTNYQAFLKVQLRELMSHYGKGGCPVVFDGLGGSASDYDSAALHALARSLSSRLCLSTTATAACRKILTRRSKTIGSFSKHPAVGIVHDHFLRVINGGPPGAGPTTE